MMNSCTASTVGLNSRNVVFFLVLAATCGQHQVISHEVLSRVVPGVLKEGQQRQVFTAGPAGRADAEGPEVSSTAAGGGGLAPHV